MANRLLPFRQYNEHDVINLFSLDTSSLNLAEMTHERSGVWDAGVIVSVTNGDMTQEPIENAGPTLQSYLGKTDYPHVGGNYYPEVPLKVSAADGVLVDPDVSHALGVTLRQTIAFDENGEKFLYYKQKLLELYGVLPGEAVPVLSKGIITVAESAVIGNLTEGKPVYIGAGPNAGKFVDNSDNRKAGICIGKGNRNLASGKLSSNDYFAGDGSVADGTGAYYVIKLDL